MIIQIKCGFSVLSVIQGNLKIYYLSYIYMYNYFFKCQNVAMALFFSSPKDSS